MDNLDAIMIKLASQQVTASAANLQAKGWLQEGTKADPIIVGAGDAEQPE